MAEITIDNIVFSNVKNVGEIVGSAPISFDNSSSGPDTELGGIINAIDIDWNGAQIDDDVIINNTGELLNYIKGAYSSGGDSSLSGFNSDEIAALKGLVNKENEEDTLTYILKLEARVAALEDALNSTVSQIAAIKTNADKLQGIDGTKLKNTVDQAIRLTKLLSDGQVIVRFANTTNNLGSLSSGPLAGIDYVTNAISGKLDESAINYDIASQTLTITK